MRRPAVEQGVTEIQESVQEEQPQLQPQQRRPRAVKLSGSMYRKVTHKSGVLVGFAFTGGLWLAGAYFTLQWIETMGVNTQGSHYWWLVPVGITLLEIGLQPESRGEAWATVLWAFILLFDTYTTGIGLSQWDAIEPHGFPWFFFGLVGFFLALSPEKFGRALWREMMR